MTRVIGTIEITSWWVIGTLVALTIGATVATVGLWDRVGWRIARRAMGLLMVQVLLLVTVAAVANRQANFYVTVGELLHTDVGDSHALDAPPGTPTLTVAADNRREVEAWLADHRPTAPGAGTVAPVVLAGATTGYLLPARVYLPAAYFEPGRAKDRFPTIMFLAGYPGTVRSWAETMRLAEALDAAIADRRIPPVLAVMPSQNPLAGRSSECVDSVDGVRADTYLTADVPAVLGRNLRVADNRTGWMVAGYSTGGFCAVNLTLRHPTRFVAAAALSGHFRPLTDRATATLFGRDKALRHANDPWLTAAQERETAVHLFLAASRGDRDAVRDLLAFAPRVQAPDTAAVVVNRPGGHNFTTWRALLPDMLAWFGRILAPISSGLI